jgi:hypothetical protein
MRGPAQKEDVAVRYMILIYEDEATRPDPGDEMYERTVQGHEKFGKANAGVARDGAALEPAGTATSIRKDSSGGFVISDGPFAETKEAVAGYIVVEAADLDTALALARQVPMEFSGVEVRPVRELD